MPDESRRPRLISNKAAGLAALLLTGFVAAQALRGLLLHKRHSVWLFPLFFSAPRWTFLALQLAFYAYLLWLCFVFFRVAVGKERTIVAAWSFAIFSGPVGSLLSRPAARALDSVAAFGLLAAFLVAMDIWLRQISQRPAI